MRECVLSSSQICFWCEFRGVLKRKGRHRKGRRDPLSQGPGRRDRGLSPDRRLVLVVVIAVCGVAVAVVQVVHMVAVRDCYVAAAFTMSVVGVSLGFYVLGGLALVPVAIVLAVDVAFVEVVGVVTVREGYVAAISAVGVGVILVGGVGHDD